MYTVYRQDFFELTYVNEFEMSDISDKTSLINQIVQNEIKHVTNHHNYVMSEDEITYLRNNSTVFTDQTEFTVEEFNNEMMKVMINHLSHMTDLNKMKDILTILNIINYNCVNVVVFTDCDESDTFYIIKD